MSLRAFGQHRAHGAITLILALAACAAPPPFAPQDPGALARSVEELRATAGAWKVVTEFYGEDGTVAHTLRGEYHLNWAVPDRVLVGSSKSEAPDSGNGILFFVREGTGEIEMVSVQGDGYLWRMIGPLGGDTRSTPEFPNAEGKRSQLRFTRFNSAPNRFESKMEHSEDGGRTWKLGNHQVFERMRP